MSFAAIILWLLFNKCLVVMVVVFLLLLTQSGNLRIHPHIRCMNTLQSEEDQRLKVSENEVLRIIF